PSNLEIAVSTLYYQINSNSIDEAIYLENIKRIYLLSNLISKEIERSKIEHLQEEMNFLKKEQTELLINIILQGYFTNSLIILKEIINIDPLNIITSILNALNDKIN